MATEATQQCKYCSAPIGFYVGHRGRWLPSNPDGTPHRCQEYYAARERRRGNAAADSVFDLEFPDVGNLTLPNHRRAQHSPLRAVTEAADPNSLAGPTESDPVRGASPQRTTLSEEHLRLLLWFHQRAGTIVPYAELETPQGEGIPAGATLVTRAKGIYKPRWSTYALSVRQTLGSTYADQEPEVRSDGSWTFVYHQEEPRNVADPATFYTNVSLGRNLADRVPVGVLIQRSSKPHTSYLVLGLAIVERWEKGLFRLRGIPTIAGARGRITPESLEEPLPHGSVSRSSTQLAFPVKNGPAEVEPEIDHEAETSSNDLDGADRPPNPRSGRKARVIKNRQAIELSGSAKTEATTTGEGVTPAVEDQEEPPAIPLPGPRKPVEPTLVKPTSISDHGDGEFLTDVVIALPARLPRAQPSAVKTGPLPPTAAHGTTTLPRRPDPRSPQPATRPHVASGSSSHEPADQSLDRTEQCHTSVAGPTKTDSSNTKPKLNWLVWLLVFGFVVVVLGWLAF